MAQNVAGKASNLTMGQSNGGTKVNFVLKVGGLNKGITGTVRGGAELVREIPKLVREIP